MTREPGGAGAMSVSISALRKPRVRPAPWTPRIQGDRALHANQVEQLVRASENGVSMPELVREFGVSRRTVYRWRAARIVRVTVEGWTARFAIRRPEDGIRAGPIQLEHWRPVEEGP